MANASFDVLPNTVESATRVRIAVVSCHDKAREQVGRSVHLYATYNRLVEIHIQIVVLQAVNLLLCQLEVFSRPILNLIIDRV